MLTETVDPLHYLAAIVSGKMPCNSRFGIDGYSGVEEAWPELIHFVQRHGLGPLLLARLQQRSDAGPSAQTLAPLVRERSQVAVHHMLAARLQQELGHAFSAVNLPCIWLKGIVLAHTVYASPELRPMVDVDVLVPYERRQAALEVAQAQGFSLNRPQLFDGREGLKHHFFLEHSTFHPLSLELHFRLLGPLDRILSVSEQEWFWQHTATYEASDGDRATTLSPETHLLYLCAHAILQHGESDLRLLRLYDLDRILANTDDFDWDLLIEGAVRMRWTYAVERALRLVQEYFATRLPDEVFAELSSMRPQSERTEHAERRRAARTTTQTVIDDLAAMSWSHRLRAAGRIAFPPPRYMRRRYGHAGTLGLPRAYLQRMRRILSDLLQSTRDQTRSNR